MLSSKYSNVLTMLLVVFIVAIIGVMGYFGYDLFNSKKVNSDAQSTLDEFQKAIKKEKVATYEVKGRIQIPKTKVDYPVLESVTKKSLEVAVGIAYGPGLNEVGNTIIYGHNYRNDLFFSKNKTLSNGDRILITDQMNNTITYIIYNIYQTDPSDASFFTRDTQGRREISLQTCTDDSKARIIIWAAEESTVQQ